MRGGHEDRSVANRLLIGRRPVRQVTKRKVEKTDRAETNKSHQYPNQVSAAVVLAWLAPRDHL